MIHERDIGMRLGKVGDYRERERGSGYRDGNRTAQCELGGGLTGPYEGKMEVHGRWERVKRRERW